MWSNKKSTPVQLFSSLFHFFLLSNGSHTVINQRRLCVCLSVQSARSNSLSFALSSPCVCVSLSFLALWRDGWAKSFLRHQANKAGNRLQTPLKIIIRIIIIMVIEVHESHLLVPPAVPTLFQRFTQHKKTLQGSIFLNNLICHEGGFFFFPTTKHKPCHQCFFFSFSTGNFRNLEIFYLKMKKYEFFGDFWGFLGHFFE